jgi:hypothetical protein
VIVRYLGSDLTIVVLANLDAAEPDDIADGIAARLDPGLAKPELAPIPDQEPQVTERLRQLLDSAAKGELRPEEFAYVRAGFFPYGAKRLQERLADLGPLVTLVPLKREDLGDDREHTYDARYGSKSFRVVLDLAPDGKIARLSARPRE